MRLRYVKLLLLLVGWLVVAVALPCLALLGRLHRLVLRIEATTSLLAGDDGRVVTERSKIALNYMSGWFFFDLVSSLPYEQMLHGSNHGIPSIVALLKVCLWKLPSARFDSFITLASEL